MEVLAYNHDTKSEMQFDNINQFNAACRWAKLELIDDKYVSASVIDDIEVEEITIQEITKEIKKNTLTETVTLTDTGAFHKDTEERYPEVIHKDEIKLYTVAKFRKELDLFSPEDLETFIKFDERATIVREATKELKKRNR